MQSACGPGLWSRNRKSYCFRWRRIKMRFTPLLILLAALQVMAQRVDNWDFLSDSSVFRDVHGMLPAYLNAKPAALLDERQQKVAQISTQADLKARQHYVRERILSYLGVNLQ